MGMARLKFKISNELKNEITTEANRIWPSSDMIAVRRLVRDCLRRLWRYANGNGRTGN